MKEVSEQEFRTRIKELEDAGEKLTTMVYTVADSIVYYDSKKQAIGRMHIYHDEPTYYLNTDIKKQ